MNKKIANLMIGATISISSAASATVIDLTSWESDGVGSWSVQAGNDSVLQTTNGVPGVFFESGSNARDTQISGEITVNESGDDDFIGFVLGYQDNELRSSSSDYWLIDWKQSDQYWGPFGGTGLEGLALSHVVNGSVEASFWTHSNGINEIARGNNLGSTGWVDFTTYTFDIVHTASLIEVQVNGNVELSVSNADAGVTEFTDGAYGFYNFSQAQVEYAGLTSVVLPPTSPTSAPEPSTLAIFALGFAALFSRKIKKK